MSAIELKSNFHLLIEKLEDTQMLQDLYNYVADFALEHPNKIDLSSDQVERIQHSLAQIEQGELIDNQTVKDKIKQWLTK
jgi:predicted transcriptional regulator